MADGFEGWPWKNVFLYHPHRNLRGISITRTDLAPDDVCGIIVSYEICNGRDREANLTCSFLARANLRPEWLGEENGMADGTDEADFVAGSCESLEDCREQERLLRHTEDAEQQKKEFFESVFWTCDLKSGDQEYDQIFRWIKVYMDWMTLKSEPMGRGSRQGCRNSGGGSAATASIRFRVSCRWAWVGLCGIRWSFC